VLARRGGCNAGEGPRRGFQPAARAVEEPALPGHAPARDSHPNTTTAPHPALWQRCRSCQKQPHKQEGGGEEQAPRTSHELEVGGPGDDAVKHVHGGVDRQHGHRDGQHLAHGGHHLCGKNAQRQVGVCACAHVHACVRVCVPKCTCVCGCVSNCTCVCVQLETRGAKGVPPLAPSPAQALRTIRPPTPALAPTAPHFAPAWIPPPTAPTLPPQPPPLRPSALAAPRRTHPHRWRRCPAAPAPPARRRLPAPPPPRCPAPAAGCSRRGPPPHRPCPAACGGGGGGGREGGHE
jgi:hypothetical protein